MGGGTVPAIRAIIDSMITRGALGMEETKPMAEAKYNRPEQKTLTRLRIFQEAKGYVAKGRIEKKHRNDLSVSRAGSLPLHLIREDGTSGVNRRSILIEKQDSLVAKARSCRMPAAIGPVNRGPIESLSGPQRSGVRFPSHRPVASVIARHHAWLPCR
jgi:hypothetical protein